MPNIGEPFYLTDVFKVLKDVDEVLDVVNIKITSITSTSHSSYQYPIRDNISPEGRVLYIPKNCIWEIKYLSDIKGTVR